MSLEYLKAFMSSVIFDCSLLITSNYGTPVESLSDRVWLQILNILQLANNSKFWTFAFISACIGGRRKGWLQEKFRLDCFSPLATHVCKMRREFFCSFPFLECSCTKNEVSNFVQRLVIKTHCQYNIVACNFLL